MMRTAENPDQYFSTHLQIIHAEVFVNGCDLNRMRQRNGRINQMYAAQPDPSESVNS